MSCFFNKKNYMEIIMEKAGKIQSNIHRTVSAAVAFGERIFGLALSAFQCCNNLGQRSAGLFLDMHIGFDKCDLRIDFDDD